MRIHSSPDSPFVFSSRIGLLFSPEPDENLATEHYELGVSLGDVGILTHGGSFDVLFNACRMPSHVINKRGVPDGFAPTALSFEGTLKHFVPPLTVITSTNIEQSGCGASWNFSASAVAAALVLPEGSSREDIRDPDPLRRQLIADALKWSDYANNTRGRMSSNLFIVTGCHKTSSWGMVSFADTSPSGVVSLEFNPTPASGDSKWSYKWNNCTSGIVRVSTNDDPLIQNQCVAARGFVLSFREAGLSDEDIPIFDDTQPVHPSIIINDWLLRTTPEAMFAITHDDDWSDIFDNTSHIPLCDDELLHCVRAKYQPMLEAGAVFLVPRASPGAYSDETPHCMDDNMTKPAQVIKGPAINSYPLSGAGSWASFPDVYQYDTTSCIPYSSVADLNNSVGVGKEFQAYPNPVICQGLNSEEFPYNFSQSVNLPIDCYSPHHDFDALEVAGENDLSAAVGAPCYMSPEIVLNSYSSQTAMTDVWAVLGALARTPWNNFLESLHVLGNSEDQRRGLHIPNILISGLPGLYGQVQHSGTETATKVMPYIVKRQEALKESPDLGLVGQSRRPLVAISSWNNIMEIVLESLITRSLITLRGPSFAPDSSVGMGEYWHFRVPDRCGCSSEKEWPQLIALPPVM